MHDIYFAIVCSLIILIIAINYYNKDINYKLPNKKKFAMLNNKIINENMKSNNLLIKIITLLVSLEYLLKCLLLLHLLSP